MSSAHPQTTTSPSSGSNFQQIINNALKVYEKRTKNDLLAHPLAAQLQACHSPEAILSVLQKQVEAFNQSRNTDERWTKWLDPTVNVLFSLSATLGEGVDLVRLRIWIDLRHAPSYVFCRSSHRQKWFLLVLVFSFWYLFFFYYFVLAVVTPIPFRQLEMFGLAKKLLSTFSSVSKVFSDGSKSTLRSHRHPK